MRLARASVFSSRSAALWFGLLGGAVAWLAHFLSAYVIAEFGCAGDPAPVALGLTGVAWLLLAVTALTAAVAAAATYAAYRGLPRGPEAPRQPEYNVARTGLLSSALFLFVILVESVPLFYYLHGC